MGGHARRRRGALREVLTPQRVGQALLAALLVAIDPRKLARFVRRLFWSPEARRREAELRQDVQVRMGHARIRRHLAHMRTLEKRLLHLAKRALALGDEDRFRQLGLQVLWTRRNIQQWERYLLTLEMLEVRRDQARVAAALMEAVKALGDSLTALAGSQTILEMQQTLERGLAQAATMEERTALMLEALDDALSAHIPADEQALTALQQQLTEDIIREERKAFDPEMEAELQRLREELGGSRS